MRFHNFSGVSFFSLSLLSSFVLHIIQHLCLFFFSWFSPFLGYFFSFFFVDAFFFCWIIFLLSSVQSVRARKDGSSPWFMVSRARGMKNRFLMKARRSGGGGGFGAPEPHRVFRKVSHCPKKKKLNLFCPWADGGFLVSAPFCASFCRGKSGWVAVSRLRYDNITKRYSSNNT